MNLGDDVLDRIEQAAKTANPGVWSAGKGLYCVVSTKDRNDGVPGADATDIYGGYLVGESIGRLNIDHIVQSQPAVVLAMVAEIRRLRAIDLRDRFAGLAMQGMITTSGAPALLGFGGDVEPLTAKAAYQMADAMLAERAKAAQ